MGFHAVGTASAALIALGCRVCKQCHKGRCMYGIATQDGELMSRLDVEEGSRRVANYLTAMAEELKILAMLAGHDDVYALGRDELRALSREAADITGLRMIGVDAAGPGRSGSETDLAGSDGGYRQVPATGSASG